MAREGVRGGGFMTHLMVASARIKLLTHLGPEIFPHKAKPRTCELRIEQQDRDS